MMQMLRSQGFEHIRQWYQPMIAPITSGSEYLTWNKDMLNMLELSPQKLDALQMKLKQRVDEILMTGQPIALDIRVAVASKTIGTLKDKNPFAGALFHLTGRAYSLLSFWVFRLRLYRLQPSQLQLYHPQALLLLWGASFWALQQVLHLLLQQPHPQDSKGVRCRHICLLSFHPHWRYTPHSGSNNSWLGLLFEIKWDRLHLRRVQELAHQTLFLGDTLGKAFDFTVDIIRAHCHIGHGVAYDIHKTATAKHHNGSPNDLGESFFVFYDPNGDQH